MLDSLERSRDAERRFVADASHELRTPLTALRGNVEHLARHGATPELVTDLQLDAERLARLADDLLALSREDAGTAPDGLVRLDEFARAAGPDVATDAPPVEVRGDRAALERALGNLVENARRHGPPGGAVTVTVAADGERARMTVTDAGRRSDGGRGRAGVRAVLASRLREWLGAGPRDRARDRRAARRACLRPRVEFYDRAARCQESVRESEYTCGRGSRERNAVKLFRTLSTTRLIALAAALVVVLAGSAVAVAAGGGGGPTPPPKPLDQAIHDALTGPELTGVTARISFTNNLFPSGALTGTTGTALMTGANGRLWLNQNGGRIELQSDAGDVQIVWDASKLTVYDASSNTAYVADLPAQTPRRREHVRPAEPRPDLDVPHGSRQALDRLGCPAV